MASFFGWTSACSKTREEGSSCSSEGASTGPPSPGRSDNKLETLLGAACEVYNAAPVPEERSHFFDYESSPGPWHTCMANTVMPPRMADAGVAGPNTPSTTIARLLDLAAEQKGHQEALLVERPVPPLEDGKAPPALPLEAWTTWSFKEYAEEVKKTARAFAQLGYQPYDSVNIWGFNSPEWCMCAVAAGTALGKSAGIYPTDTPETAAYKIVHSGGSIVALDAAVKANKLVKSLDARGDCRRLRAFVIWGEEQPEAGQALPVKGLGNVPLIGWDALMGMGSAQEAEIDRRMAAADPGNCAALIYTSGTTGEPKAVMVSSDCLIFEANAFLECVASADFGTKDQERTLSYLPQSHIAGCLLDIVAPIVTTAWKPSWWTMYFARSYDLKVGAIKDRLCSARPTAFLGVPLVWEKIADKLRAIGASTTGVKKAIATWAKELGLQRERNCQLGGNGRYPFGYGLANAIVLNNIKGALGLADCKIGLTGAAPIRVDTLEYFGSLGLNINEVYGMSECTGAATLSTNQAHTWGSCGYQLPGVEVKAFLVDPRDLNKKTERPRAPDLGTIEEEFQGELCFRGRNIMMGYLANPDLGPGHIEEIGRKTAETIDREGWLHSGDKGMITKAGMVKITGRYKELIIGEGGENIAPVPIEDCVKKACDGICEIMMIGDKRKYNVALVTLKAVGANGESPGTDNLDAGAARVNPAVKTISAAMDDATWIKAVTDAITAANNNGKVCPNSTFKIQKFTILPFNFSEEKGELTPTKKLKRKVIETVLRALVDRMYETDGVYIRYQR